MDSMSNTTLSMYNIVPGIDNVTGGVVSVIITNLNTSVNLCSVKNLCKSLKRHLDSLSPVC